jgi:hypothetical protein
MPEADVLLRPLATQVEIPVAQPDILGNGRVLGNLKRWRPGLIQHPDSFRDHLNLAGCQLQIDGLVGSAPYWPPDPNDVLRPKVLCLRQQALVVPDDDLRETLTVADVDEDDAPKVADAVHPAKEHSRVADVTDAKSATGVRACEVAERLCHL